MNVLFLLLPCKGTLNTPFGNVFFGRYFLESVAVGKGNQAFEVIFSATVCQEPERQGAEPLRILFDYLALGMNPERNVVYTDNEIMIRECL